MQICSGYGHNPCECSIVVLCLALDLACHAFGNVSASFAGSGSDTHLPHMLHIADVLAFRAGAVHARESKTPARNGTRRQSRWQQAGFGWGPSAGTGFFTDRRPAPHPFPTPCGAEFLVASARGPASERVGKSHILPPRKTTNTRASLSTFEILLHIGKLRRVAGTRGFSA